MVRRVHVLWSLLLLAQLTGAQLATAEPQLGLIPAPASIVVANGGFELQPDMRIMSADPKALPVANYAKTLLQDYAARTRVQQLQSGARPPRGIMLQLTSDKGANPEAYELDVNSQRVLITASDARGLRYGVVTLWQMLSAKPGTKRIPALHIKDQPRFSWRGLLLDSARHYQSPQFITRFLDQMALHKLNVLHWHLTDDQGWRLEIKRYPRLTEVGAWRTPAGASQGRRYGGYYTQEQVRAIVAHAQQLGITIVPEIEMPGHASAAIVAYPELGVDRPELTAVPADWGVYTNLFNLEDSTFEFLQNVLDEVMALFPGEYIHIGGDEAVKDQWLASASIQRRKAELDLPDEHALQSYFVQRMGKFLLERGRRLVGWEEILEGGGLAQNATVMSWRGLEAAATAAATGHDTVLAASPTLYLDHINSDAPDEPPGRGGVVGVRDIHDFDPAPPSLAGAEQHVIGVQASLWTEHVRTEARVEHMTFPRAAALAEVAWTPAAARRGWEDFSARLAIQTGRYTRQGINFARTSGVKQVVQHPRSMTARTSHELQQCTNKLVLALEDDAPWEGERAVFLVDIMNPCWIFPQVDLAQIASLSVDVGQVPFNFQVGADVKSIPLDATAVNPELEVYAGSCSGSPLLRVSLTAALTNDGVTHLPPQTIPSTALSGRQDLCFKFARAQVDPIWVIDRIQLNSKPH